MFLVKLFLIYAVILFFFWIYLFFSEDGFKSTIKYNIAFDFILSYLIALFMVPLFLVVEGYITIREIFS